MSRFIDILKEASRNDPQAAKVDGGWDAFPDATAVAADPPAAKESVADSVGGTTPNGSSGAAQAEEALKDLLDSFDVPQITSLGVTTQIHLDQKARLITHSPDSVVLEHYRRLRTKLLQLRAAKPFRSLIVASPNPQEGKTVTVLNLGLIFAMLPDFRVLVVDGDVRKGSLGRWMGVDDRPGLVNLLDGSARLEEVVFKCEDMPLHFVVRGKTQALPGELLNAPPLKTYLRRMAEYFDLVLVDSPPVNMVTDPQLLAAGCDGVLLVARAYSTTCKHFQKMVHDFAGNRIVGAVLNGGTRSELYRGYKGYY